MSTEAKVTIPEEHLKVLNETDLVLQQFSAFMSGNSTTVDIRNEEEYANAATVITTVKQHKKLVEASKDAVVKPVYEEYKEKLAVFTAIVKKIDDKITALESAGRRFRARVQEEARQKQIEADRIAAEERRKAEEKAAAERANEEAYRDAGRNDLADKAAARATAAEIKATETVAPVISANIPQNFRGSFNTTKRYAARIKRVDLLIKHFAENPTAVPANVLAEAEKWASAQARAAKSTVSTIPGVEFYEVL